MIVIRRNRATTRWLAGLLLLFVHAAGLGAAVRGCERAVTQQSVTSIAADREIEVPVLQVSRGADSATLAAGAACPGAGLLAAVTTIPHFSDGRLADHDRPPVRRTGFLLTRLLRPPRA